MQSPVAPKVTKSDERVFCEPMQQQQQQQQQQQ
jgi:hypothetical protein